MDLDLGETLVVKKPNETIVDYSSANPIPEWIQKAIDTQLSIDEEDAHRAGQVGYMARALVLASMPYKDPKADIYERKNGKFRLRILAGYYGGIPYGIYPRLLMSWITTECVRTQSPTLELGQSLRNFLLDIMDVRHFTGGKNGSITRITEQMKRLFGSVVTASFEGDDKPFRLRGVMISRELTLDEKQFQQQLLEDQDAREAGNNEKRLWTPLVPEDAGKWQSELHLNYHFFEECVTSPVPIDLRAYKALRGSPMAMDLYNWLTYRMSYTRRTTHPIPWESLMMQFGADFSGYADKNQAVRDFKKLFIQAAKAVQIVYSEVKLDAQDNGLVLHPSPTHIKRPEARQGNLFLQ
jgi:hypothetical protein